MLKRCVLMLQDLQFILHLFHYLAVIRSWMDVFQFLRVRQPDFNSSGLPQLLSKHHDLIIFIEWTRESIALQKIYWTVDGEWPLLPRTVKIQRHHGLLVDLILRCLRKRKLVCIQTLISSTVTLRAGDLIDTYCELILLQLILLFHVCDVDFAILMVQRWFDTFVWVEGISRRAFLF